MGKTTTTDTNEMAKIAATESALVTKYGDKIVPGSVRRAPEGSKYGRKMLVDIRTRGLDGEYDGGTRTVATSDVFQVHHSDEVAAELKKLRLAEKRAEKAAAKPAKADKAPAKAKGKGRSRKAKDVAEALGVE